MFAQQKLHLRNNAVTSYTVKEYDIAQSKWLIFQLSHFSVYSIISLKSAPLLLLVLM